MPMTASLPMYNAPGMRAANTAFWKALSGLLREAGLDGVPENLSFERPPVPDRIGDDVLFTQVCGYPLQTLYKGQYQLLARPRYDAAGCTGSTHSAFLVARKSSSARRVADLRGQRFALNSLHSNSGMNLPRRMLAEVAGGKPFFGEVLETGGHGASMRRVVEGGADCASIDCLTYVFSQDHQPEWVEGLRVIAQTPSSPTLPFVTSARTDDATVAVMRRCLYQLSAEPRFAEVLSGLRIARIEPAPPAEYSALLDHGLRAAELGYPILA